jgi:hypothetical protein
MFNNKFAASDLERSQTSPVEQVQPHSALKPTYGFVSTREVIGAFEARGWNVSSQAFGKVKRQDKQGYQKHLIRLDNFNLPTISGLSKDNESRVQLCLVNSHDGTAALRMFLGVLRIACLNGIIAGSALADFRAVHSGSITSKIDTGIDFLTDNVGALITQVQQLQALKFSEAGQADFVRTLIDARLASVKNVQQVAYTDALRARRFADKGQDAYTIFNRVQEAVIRGGVRYTYLQDIKDASGAVIRQQLQSSTTRAISSVPTQLRLNRLAYDKALEIAA